MQLTNNIIYTLAQLLSQAFTDKSKYLPVRVNFAIVKNTQTLSALAQEIEQSRIGIITHYGEVNQETGDTVVPEHLRGQAAQEFNELLAIAQEVNILKIRLQDLDGIDMTMEQMNAIMFMIDEE